MAYHVPKYDASSKCVADALAKQQSEFGDWESCEKRVSVKTSNNKRAGNPVRSVKIFINIRPSLLCIIKYLVKITCVVLSVKEGMAPLVASGLLKRALLRDLSWYVPLDCVLLV